jgi:Domain of unknown function (DUF1735)
MKKNKFKYVTSFTAYLSAAIILLSSCIKSRDGYTDFSNLKPIVQIPEGGFKNFGKAALTFPSSDLIDSVEFYVNYASTNVASGDVTITLGYDAAALSAYNADGANKIKYEKMPDSLYMFTSTKVVVKKGNNYAGPVKFYVYPNKVDPTKNYMFPLSIIDAQGNNISGNFGTVYYHMIGNTLAGSYTRNYIRWNNATGTGTPTTQNSTTIPLSPDDPFTVQAQSGYGSQNGFNCRYLITFDLVGGVYSNLKVVINPDDIVNSLTANGITLTADASIIYADPVNKKFKFSFAVTNSAGAPRVFTDEYIK